MECVRKNRPTTFFFLSSNALPLEMNFVRLFSSFFYNEIWYIIKPGLFLTRPDILLEYLMKNSSDELAEGIKFEGEI